MSWWQAVEKHPATYGYIWPTLEKHNSLVLFYLLVRTNYSIYFRKRLLEEHLYKDSEQGMIILCPQITDYQQNKMTMSPFIIFAIVLTIAYVLYYATIITMDLNGKSKKEGEQEETIPAVEDKELKEEYAPQTVVENTETGGFAFIEAEHKEESVIEEEKPIDEERSDMSSDASDGIQKQENESSSETPQAPIETAETDNVSEAAEEEQPTEESFEEDTIPTVDFSENPKVDKDIEEPFDESKAFNPDLAQPRYTVSSIIENKKDKALSQRIERVEQKLQNCQAEGKLINPYDFANEAQGDREKSKIEFKDEYTQC